MGKCVSKQKKRPHSKLDKPARAKIEGYDEVRMFLKNRDDIPQNFIYLLLNRMNFKPIPKKIDKVQEFLHTFKIAKLALIDLELVEFKFNLPSTARTLDLTQNKISKLGPVVLKATSLKKLCLKQNSFESIPNKISKLKNLRSINLNENKIMEFTRKPFIGLNIKTIHLSHNLIEELAISLDHLPKLEFLDLSNNKIKFIEDKFFGHQHNILSFLSLRNNLQLNSIPESIENCTQLEILEVDNTNLTALPLSLGTLNQLICIELSYQKVSKPPSYISAEGALRIKDYLKKQMLKKVSKVDNWEMFLDYARHNQVSKIVLKNLEFDHSEEDPTVFELNNILGNYLKVKKVSIQCCKLPSIPYTLPGSVTNLILKDNLIKEVPKIVLKENLEKLDLSSNKIQVLEFKSANSLSILNLSDNLIESIGSKCFLKMSKLKFLNLSQNRIKNLDIRLSQLENLAALNLSMNLLGIIPISFFDTENFKLLTLLLNDNRLLEMPLTIYKLKALEYLDIQNNQITYLPRPLLEMESIEKITIHGNNFDCSEGELTKQNMAQFAHLLVEKERHGKNDGFNEEEEDKKSNLDDGDKKSTMRDDRSERDKIEREKSEVPSGSFFKNVSEPVLNREKLVSVKERKKPDKLNRIEISNNKEEKTCLLENPAYANTQRAIEELLNVKEYISDLFYEESNANNILSCLQTIQNILFKILPDDKMKPKAITIPILSDYYAKRIVNYRSASKLLKYVGFSLSNDSTHQTILRIKFSPTHMDYMNPDILRRRVKALKKSIATVTKTFSIDKDRDELKSDIRYLH